MDYGVHLPLIDFDGEPVTLARLSIYTETADRLHYSSISANDHMVFSKPWLDGPIALASVINKTGSMTLGTTVALPVVRGPVPLSKALSAIDLLSEGRLFVGVGPGSSQRDYETVGIPFEERWKRLDEAIMVLRVLLKNEAEFFKGSFYSTDGVVLEPKPFRKGGPPILVGSWGSKFGLRRAARLGDGWLASAYNTTPELFKSALMELNEYLITIGKDPENFPNAIASMFMYVTRDGAKAKRMLRDVLSPTLRRAERDVHNRLLIGSPNACAEKLTAFKLAGAQRVFLWPVADELTQLEIFMHEVAPLVRP
jgi:alkanesulfonate monooxygenase SsuD/methylene tetrahydromethanopterin reductase-like flavin-dependent oxidoreductase (luciferase family)